MDAMDDHLRSFGRHQVKTEASYFEIVTALVHEPAALVTVIACAALWAIVQVVRAVHGAKDNPPSKRK